MNRVLSAAIRVNFSSSNRRRRRIGCVVNARQETDSRGTIIEAETNEKAIRQNPLGRLGCDEPFPFDHRERSAIVHCGNAATMAPGRIDRRGIGNSVHRRDKKQQADDPDGVLAFQILSA